jgi:hypothetical protein
VPSISQGAIAIPDEDGILPAGTSKDLVLVPGEVELEEDDFWLLNTITIIVNPLHGNISNIRFSDDGQNILFTFTAFPDYNGTDQFIFEITTAKDKTARATVNLIITPLIIPDQSQTQFAGTIKTGLLIDNNINLDGASWNLSTIVIPSPSLHGTASNFRFASNGSIIFDFFAFIDYGGPDSFTFEITTTDGRVITATVWINIVLLPPTLVIPDKWYRLRAGTKKTINLVDDKAKLPDGDEWDPNTFKIVIKPRHGKAVNVQFNPSTGEFEAEFVADDKYNGKDFFTFEISTKTRLTAQAKVHIKIRAPSRPQMPSAEPTAIPTLTPTVVPKEHERGVCTGGQGIVLLAFVMNLFSFSGNHAWALVNWIQFLAYSGNMGIDFTNNWAEFSSCFHWIILDIPYPWDMPEYYHLVEKTGRYLLSLESPEFTKNSEDTRFFSTVFWFAIGLAATVLVMSIVYVVSLFCLRRNQNKNASEENEKEGDSKHSTKEELKTQRRELKASAMRRLQTGGVLSTFSALLVSALLRFLQFTYLGVLLSAFLQINIKLIHDKEEAGETATVFAFLIATLYGPGIIFAFLLGWFFLRRHLGLFTNSWKAIAFGGSYLQYQSKYSWWGVMTLLLQFLIAAIVGLLDRYSLIQVILIGVFYLTYLLLLVVFRPFVSRFAFIQELWCLVLLPVFFLLFLLYRVDAITGSALFTALIWVAWAVIIGYFLLELFYLTRLVWKKRKN